MIRKDNNTKMKGFTLVELLAVIVILAIILVIAVPKIMSVIEDAKKATLESTAKMIASSAEKAKVQNTVLGKTDAITCDSVTKINDVDYEDCDIDFDNNTAKVTIKGSGKFEGLYICSGTKTSANAQREKCPTQPKAGALYITNLLKNEETLHNGLIQTTAIVNEKEVDSGIRYAGNLDSVKNKVYFNCKDIYNDISYGNEGYDYENACEVWRIIGVFYTKSTSSETEDAVPRIKIVRNHFSIPMSWDSSSSGDSGTENNSGYGINEWSQADIQRMLNGYYIGLEGATCTYCEYKEEGTCSSDCSSSVNPLSDTSLNMIDDALWYTGATTYSKTSVSLQTMYAGERGTQNGKLCTTSGDRCNDSVERTTTWVGKIGLIYPSDYAYASTNEGCASNIINGNCTCNLNNWLNSNTQYWTISPTNRTGLAYLVYSVAYDGIHNTSADSAIWIRPTLYLSSDIEIIDGDGADKPYILK